MRGYYIPSDDSCKKNIQKIQDQSKTFLTKLSFLFIYLFYSLLKLVYMYLKKSHA